jgi:hypothetical protein
MTSCPRTTHRLTPGQVPKKDEGHPMAYADLREFLETLR